MPPPVTRGWTRATYRGGGGRGQQRKDAPAGDDDVVHHLRDEMDGVVDEDDVLVAVHEVHYRFGGVTARRGKEDTQTSDGKSSGSHYYLSGVPNQNAL